MTAPTVSIALGVYNGAAHLTAQLDSLLAQRDVTLEIVASDDASTDNSATLLADYAARDPRLRLLQQSRRLGFSANFTAAMSACRGTFICPSDQDDLWHPEKLRRLLTALGDADLVYCDSEMIDANGRPLGRRLSQDRGMYSGHDPLVFVLSNCISGHALLFRREILQRALPMPEGLYYDWWLAIVAACGNGVRYLDEPLVQFRRHDRTVTSFGGVRLIEGVNQRVFLQERLRLLEAIGSLASPRQAEAQRLATLLHRWLEHGEGLPFLLAATRLYKPLLTPLRPRLGTVAQQSLKYLRLLFGRP